MLDNELPTAIYMQRHARRLRLAVVALALIAALAARSAAQANSPTAAKGEVVSELGQSVLHVFQAKNDDYWFGSDDRGVYRYDGKTLVNFTTDDGLVSNQIKGIQEDKSGNIYFTTYAGISKFDGKAFTTLSVAEDSAATEWKKQPDDLWFVGPPDSGAVYRYDGKMLHRLELPKTKIGEDLIAEYARSKYPNIRHLPYDVYTIFRDSKGHLWFGTGSAGLCRFDGESFAWLYEQHLTDVAGGGSFGIRSIFEDKAGAFWICNTRYRYRVDPKDAPDPGKELVKYAREVGIEVQDLDGADRVYFMSIVEDEKGVLWMASYGSGVWRYDGDKVTRYPVKDGDQETTLFSIYKDNRGDLWLGTHQAGAYKWSGKMFEKFRP